ncbi:MAG: glycosyltransferase [Pseudomonadota bacterium]
MALDGSARGTRIIFYSHDTFGLGHLRRSRALATAMTRADPTASALILTGSPVAGRFAFPERVDHVRLPGVTKLSDGSYVSLKLGTDIDEITALRGSLIQTSIESFEPDLLIVDKEPTGFRGELLPSLEMLVGQSRTKCILGLRDVLDEADVLAAEWERKGATEAAQSYYDEIWVYGPKSFYDPVQGLNLSSDTRDRMHWTGFLRRQMLQDPPEHEEDYILVTPGGGGDGADMVDLVMTAYEQNPDLGPHAKIVYGPFLSGETRAQFEERVAVLDGRVSAVGFESQIEHLYAGAQGVVCMGGYNTFCEILSFDKRAVILPRTKPRKEQLIRASRAEDLGLVRMLTDGRAELTPHAVAQAIRSLPNQPKPSQAGAQDLMGGLTYVCGRAAAMMRGTQTQSSAAE